MGESGFGLQYRSAGGGSGSAAPTNLPGDKWRVALMLAASALVVLVGQVKRELLPPDDLREAEIAREMLADGDFILPHLAGLPFVEKPPAFPIIVAAAFRIAGGPSVMAARTVVVAFAFLSLTAVFLFGRRLMGAEGGALAAAFLALSMRFCRTAHELLLDNALTAACAFALFFLWAALEAETPHAKRRRYAAAGLAIGMAFLVKGFVGPILIGSGFLSYLAARGRLSELRHALRPLPAAAFLVPVLAWVIPFLQHAPAWNIYAFFVENQFDRAAYAFASHSRPIYYYLTDIWSALAPASLLLPFAVRTIWRERGRPGGETGLYLLISAAVPTVILSLARAKDSVYLLPAYPALSLLIAWFVERAWKERAKGARRGGIAGIFVCGVAAAAAVMATWLGGGGTFPVMAAAALLVLGFAAAIRALRRDDLRGAAAYSVLLMALGWVLWFTGPIAQFEVRERTCRPAIETMLEQAGGRDIILYRPNDAIRGATGFYGNRTAREVASAPEVVARLAGDPLKVAVLRVNNEESLPPALVKAAEDGGVRLYIESVVSYTDTQRLVLVRTDTGSASSQR